MPAALITFEKLEDIYRLYLNGVPSGAGVGLVAGKRVGFNVYFVNTGTATANDVRGHGKVYLVGDNKHESSVVARFKRELQGSGKDPLRATLDAGGHDEHWFTAQSDRPITQDDINKLAYGKEYIYLLFSESYHDPTGTHEQHYCKLLQPPAFDPEVWQICKDFSDRH